MCVCLIESRQTDREGTLSELNEQRLLLESYYCCCCCVHVLFPSFFACHLRCHFPLITNHILVRPLIDDTHTHTVALFHICNKFNGQEAYNTDNRLAKSSKSNLKPRRTSAYMQGVRVRNVLKHVNRTIPPHILFICCLLVVCLFADYIVVFPFSFSPFSSSLPNANFAVVIAVFFFFLLPFLADKKSKRRKKKRRRKMFQLSVIRKCTAVLEACDTGNSISRLFPS